MTRKTAKKTAARARQEKTGQSYASALRAEGKTFIKIKNDDVVPPEEEALALFNEGNSAIIEDDHCYVVVNRHYEKGQRTDLFAPVPHIFPEALDALRRLPPLAGRKINPENILQRRREGMIRMFEEAIDVCAVVIDKEHFPGEPMFSATVEFTFPNGKRIMSLPAHHLRDPIPYPLVPARAEPVPPREPINPADPETRINMAFSVLNNGLYHGGIHTPTREQLYGRIQHALHILVGSSDEKINEAIENGWFEPPKGDVAAFQEMVKAAKEDPDFKVIENPGGFTPKKPLEGFKINPPPLRGWSLDTEVPIEPLPKEVRDKRHVYEKFYADDPTPTVKHNVEPQKLMAYWKGLPEAKRIIHSRQRLLGVTDDHPEKPLITWTLLTQVKECPEDFGAWWEQLPESKQYDRAQDLCDFTWQAPRAQGYPHGGKQTVHCTMPKGHVGGPDENTLRHTHDGPDGSALFDVPLHPWRQFQIEPEDTVATWVEKGPSAKVPDSPLIRKFKGSFPKTLPSGFVKVHVKFCLEDGSCWGQDHDLIIPGDEVVRGRYALIQRAFELLRKECEDSGKTPDPNDIRFVSYRITSV